MQSIPSPTPMYGQSDVYYVDQVMLVVEFEEHGPRVAGIMADRDWWGMLCKPSNVMGVSYYMSLVDALAILLLEGEIQVCSKVPWDEEKTWYEGRMKLRLHYSRLASMIMLIAGPTTSLTQPEIKEALKKWRALHPQSDLCHCEHELEENRGVQQRIRDENMNEIRGLLKRDATMVQKELLTQCNIFQLLKDLLDSLQDWDPLNLW